MQSTNSESDITPMVRSTSAPDGDVMSSADVTEVSSESKHELLRSLSFNREPPPSNTCFTPATYKVADMRPNLHRTFREIPFDVRERVVNLVTRAENNADEAKKVQLAMNKELLNLRRDYYQTDKEVSVQLKKRDFYVNQINLYNEKLGALEDDAESRRVRALKNAEAIHRLSRTNKNLVDAFSKLYDDGPTAEISDDDGNEKPASKKRTVIKKKLSMRRGNIATTTNEPPSPPKDSHQEPVAATSNEKLRERLLDVAKEHNRVVKNVEILEIKVEGLRSSVRFADRRNRQLKAELDELRESASLDGSSTVELLEAKNAGKDEAAAAAAKKPKTQRAATTARLTNLLANPGFDALDGIRHLDALLQHIVATPTTMSEREVASHLCNRFACHIFKARVMCVFLVQPGGQVMNRYTTDSNEVKVIPLVTPRVGAAKISCSYAPSIAEWVVRHKETCCLINPEKHKKFRIEVDRPTGVAAVKRLLSVPLWDLHDGAVVGAVHIINKVTVHERFSMADERFAASYGELAGALVASSAKYNRLGNQSQSICSLAQAPLQLIDSFHDVDVMTLADALCALEETLRETLHCAHAKAYLFSPDRDKSEQKDGDGGDIMSLFTLDLPPRSLKGASRDISSVQVKRCPLSAKDDPDFKPSIVAYTVNTQRTYLAGTIVPPDHHDYAALRPEGAEYNSAVDMAPSASQIKKSKSYNSLDGAGKDKSVPIFYCVPIINLKQEVIGCLQASPSSKSPPLKSVLDIGTTEQIHSITFQDAMGWAGYFLSAKVTYLNSKINQPIDRHGFFLEPLSITRDLSAMEISLAPSEPEKLMPRCITAAEVDNQISEWNRSYDSLKKKPTSGGGGGGGGSNQGSNNNTGRTTPEKEGLSHSMTEDSAGSPGADKTPPRSSEEATVSPVKKRKELKEYVTQMRDMHRIIEQLRLEARSQKNTAGARREQKVRSQLAKEHEDKIQAEVSAYQHELESGSAETKKVASDKRSEFDKLKSQMEEFKAAAKKRDEVRAMGAERRKCEQLQAEEERQQRLRLRAEEVQKRVEEDVAAKRKADEEAQLAQEKKREEEEKAAAQKKAEEEAQAFAEKQAEEEARLEKIRLEEEEEARQRAEDAAIIREAEEEAARKLREEEERERLATTEHKDVVEENMDNGVDENKHEVLNEGATVEAEVTVEGEKEFVDMMQQAFGEVSDVDANGVQHDDAALCWEECLDDTGATFYYNTQTEESVWDAPEKFKPLHTNQVEGTNEVDGWVRMEDNNGEVYWVNEETGETEWGPTPPV